MKKLAESFFLIAFIAVGLFALGFFAHIAWRVVALGWGMA